MNFRVILRRVMLITNAATSDATRKSPARKHTHVTRKTVHCDSNQHAPSAYAKLVGMALAHGNWSNAAHPCVGRRVNSERGPVSGLYTLVLADIGAAGQLMAAPRSPGSPWYSKETPGRHQKVGAATKPARKKRHACQTKQICTKAGKMRCNLHPAA